MALFLSKKFISVQLEQLIKEAKKKIVLVSPYFQTSESLREWIRTKSEYGKLEEITIIYGKEDLKKSELDWMKSIKNLTILEKKNNHAKCYLNEQRAIICSMNLYEYSEINNIEMGILITKKEDPVAFRSLMDEINHLKLHSTHKWGEKAKSTTKTFEELLPTQKLYYKLINELVGYELNRKKNENPILLTKEELLSLASCETLNSRTISELLSKEKVEVYCEGIIKKMNYAQRFTLGKVQRIIRDSGGSYPIIIFKLQSGEVLELNCTENNLPSNENIQVAVRINEAWFNQYYTLSN